jgi:hypothetical protein
MPKIKETIAPLQCRIVNDQRSTDFAAGTDDAGEGVFEENRQGHYTAKTAPDIKKAPFDWTIDIEQRTSSTDPEAYTCIATSKKDFAIPIGNQTPEPVTPADANKHPAAVRVGACSVNPGKRTAYPG